MASTSTNPTGTGPVGTFEQTFWCGPPGEYKVFARVNATIYKSCVYTRIYFLKTLPEFTKYFPTPRHFVYRDMSLTAQGENSESICGQASMPQFKFFSGDLTQVQPIKNMVLTVINCDVFGAMGIKANLSIYEKDLYESIQATLQIRFPSRQDILIVPNGGSLRVTNENGHCTFEPV